MQLVTEQKASDWINSTMSVGFASVQCAPTDGYPDRGHEQYERAEQGDYRDDPEHEGERERDEGGDQRQRQRAARQGSGSATN